MGTGTGTELPRTGAMHRNPEACSEFQRPTLGRTADIYPPILRTRSQHVTITHRSTRRRVAGDACLTREGSTACGWFSADCNHVASAFLHVV